MGKTKIKTIDETIQEEPKVTKDKETSETPKETKKSTKPGKAKPRSKKYQEVSKDLDRTKSYPIDEAVDMVKKLSYAKFEASLEAHINTYAMDLRGFVSLPYAEGKTEYKTEAKVPVIHMALGKLTQPNEELSANIKTLLSTVGKTKIKKVRLSPTMGPSVKVDLASLS